MSKLPEINLIEAACFIVVIAAAVGMLKGIEYCPGVLVGTIMLWGLGKAVAEFKP